MRTQHFLMAAISLLWAFACEKPEESATTPEPKPEEPQITVSKESEAIFSSGINFQAGTSAQTASLTFTASEAWSTDITETKAPAWLSVQPSSGNAGTVNMTVTAQPNTEVKARSATVTIKCSYVSVKFTVKQAAAEGSGNKEVTSVTLNKTSLALTKGQSETLTATVAPADATDKSVTWSSSDATIAGVDQNGKVTALKSGSATITAKAGNKQATCSVSVSTPVESIALDRTSVSLAEGQSTTLTATVSPADADEKTVTWSSSDASVATVTDGVVKAVKEGTAVITAKVGNLQATCTVSVQKNIVPVTSVTLNKTTLSLTKGQSETLTATVSPADATDKSVTWSSSDATVASVEQDGTVTALKSGSATITAKAGEKQATCSVSVSTPVESIALDRTSVTLEEGQSTTLTATISPNDADDQSVSWSSSDATVASVDQNGKVTAVKSGSATITAKAGNLEASCAVTVQKSIVPVTSVTLNKTTLSLTKGQSETLTATVSPANATDKSVTWSSSDATIASVDQNGKVTAVKSGSATITAKAGEQSATCAVTITTPVQSVTLNTTSVTLDEGQTTTLTATVNPSDADDKTVSWSSSAPSVATVSNGVVTAVKEGTATITASVGGKKATCQVTVQKHIVPVVSVTLNKTSLTMNKDDIETLTATVAPADATDSNVSWSSSDATVASVDQFGTVRALKSGNATITAEAGGKQATCSVTVITPVELISLDRTSVTLEEGQSTTLTLTITPANADVQNIAWKSSNPSVATVSDGVISAVAEGRATVTVQVDNLQASCSVEVKKYVFELNPNKVEIAASVSTFTVTVNTSHSYHINSMPEWITEKSVSGKVHTFEAQANPSADKRSGVIVFCDDKGTCLPCNVTQDGAGPFEITPASVELEADGGQFEVSVSCSTTYHINSQPDWVEEITPAGNGKVHVFKVGKNTSEQARSGVIVFCDDQGTCLPCNVKQKGYVPDTAGGGNEDVNDGDPITW